DVTDVAHDVVDGVAAEKTGAEDDADDAPFVGDGAKLLVVDVAPVPEGAHDPGVRHDGRPRGHAARVEEPVPVEVGEIDDDARVLAAPYELLPPAGEAVTVASAAPVRG